jgi:hypothetical protein
MTKSSGSTVLSCAFGAGAVFVCDRYFVTGMSKPMTAAAAQS